MKTKYKYIYFKEWTNFWEVLTNKNNLLLGTIYYYTPFQQYSFSPTEHTTFSPDCLADIIDFIKQLEKP